MVPDFLKYLSQDEEKHFSARKYYSSIFFTKDQSPHKIDSLNDPDDDPVPARTREMMKPGTIHRNYTGMKKSIMVPPKTSQKTMP